MTMRFLVSMLMMIIAPVKVYATTCIETKEKIEKLSEEYRDKISINIDKDGSEQDVTLSLPLEIKGEKLSYIMIVKEIGEKILFGFPLRSRQEDNKILAWYVIDTDLSRDSFVEITYGEDCGYGLRYKVK